MRRRVVITGIGMVTPLTGPFAPNGVEQVAGVQAYMREHGDFDVARAGWLADYPDSQNFLALAQSGVCTARWAACCASRRGRMPPSRCGHSTQIRSAAIVFLSLMLETSQTCMARVRTAGCVCIRGLCAALNRIRSVDCQMCSLVANMSC